MIELVNSFLWGMGIILFAFAGMGFAAWLAGEIGGYAEYRREKRGKKDL